MDNSGSPFHPNSPQPERSSHKLRRPGSVTILLLGVLIITALNLTRFVLGIQEWDFLLTQPGVSPVYIVLTGLIWSVAGIPLAYGLWRAKKWAPRLLQALALTYALYFWLDQVFLVDHPLGGTDGALQALLPANWQFAAVVTLISLAFIAWTSNRQKVKAYFGTPLPGNSSRDA